MSEKVQDLESAADYDAPIPYLERVPDYYRGLGYKGPYRWAHYAEVLFRALGKPLTECPIAVITSAAPYQPDKGDQGRAPPTLQGKILSGLFGRKCERPRFADPLCR
jgi:D-proline reductase (dithiol) PrdB